MGSSHVFRPVRPRLWFETPLGLWRWSRYVEATLRFTPLAALPAAVLLFGSELPPWAFMWLLAFAIYAGFKWFTWRPAHAAQAFPNAFYSAGYLLFWPGMQAEDFCARKSTLWPSARDVFFAWLKMTAGLLLLAAAIPHLPPVAAAWTGMGAILLVLHFGLFDLLHQLWTVMGVQTPKVMNAPLRATSLAEFWSARWNLAFRALAHDFVFRPLTRRFGIRFASFAGFLFSGIIHDVVISVPAGGGFGMPTVYFLLQWLGIQLERSAMGKRLGLQHGVRGWCFTVLVTVAPVGLLFHEKFMNVVLLPFLAAIGAR
ncbi:MAG TPA: MBOAT family protein [Planctomycetota bacterium]|nr:MBOAT family protein [Planctomycetota bacterium]